MNVRLFYVLFLFVTPLTASDWGTWSGPNRDLTLIDGAFERKAFALELAWTKDLGSAYSRISVVDGKVVTGFSDGTDDFFVALAAADGTELWRYRIAETYKGHDGSDDGPLSSPTIHGKTTAEGIVYGLGPFGHLFALRLADGAPIWEKKLDDLGRKPEYGYTTIPLVADDLLVVETGGDESAVVAFDRATGARRWAVVEGSVTYESPALVELRGRTQVVAVTGTHAVGLDPKDGTTLWSHQYSEGEYEGIAHPIPVGDERLLLTTWNETILLDLSGEAPVEAWRSRDLARTYGLPVPYDGYLYGYNGAFLSAVSLETGEKVWKSRPPGRGSLMLVDGHLVIQVESSGEVVIAAATPEGYQEKTRVKALESGSYAAPTFASGQAYVRNLKQISAIRVIDAPQGDPAEDAEKRP